MYDSTSTYRTEVDDPAKYTSHYVRRLLAERHHIRAKLENQGGSVILTATSRVDADRDIDYSGQIGNPFHLDLIELEMWMSELTKGERDALEAWSDGMNTQQAAIYLNAKGSISAIRKRRQRGIEHITGKANDQSGNDRHGGYSAPRVRLTAEDLSTPTWHLERKT